MSLERVLKLGCVLVQDPGRVQRLYNVLSLLRQSVVSVFVHSLRVLQDEAAMPAAYLIHVHIPFHRSLSQKLQRVRLLRTLDSLSSGARVRCRPCCWLRDLHLLRYHSCSLHTTVTLCL